MRVSEVTSRIRIALGTVLALAGCVGLYYAVRPRIAAWRLHRLEIVAQALYANGDSRGAALTARTILQSDPSNDAACRVLAQYASALRLPSALSWWRRVVEIEPGKSAPLLELAKKAVDLDQPAAADGPCRCLNRKVTQLQFNSPNPDSHSFSATRMASGLEGFGSGCWAIQVSRADKVPRSSRVLTASLSTVGRPRGDFLALAIDILKL